MCTRVGGVIIKELNAYGREPQYDRGAVPGIRVLDGRGRSVQDRGQIHIHLGLAGSRSLAFCLGRRFA
jgi:hypothetical protein